MKKTILWTEYIIEDNIKGIDFDEIIRFAYELKSNSSGRLVSNCGGWQSDFLKNNQNKEIDKLKVILNDKFNSLNIEKDKNLSAESMWLNINTPGSSNMIHNHIGAYFCGVVYLRAEKNMGNIYFSRFPSFDNINTHKNISGMDTNKFLIEYPSLTGKLYMFSPFLFHSVGSNDTNQDRVSISFNMDPVFK